MGITGIIYHLLLSFLFLNFCKNMCSGDRSIFAPQAHFTMTISSTVVGMKVKVSAPLNEPVFRYSFSSLYLQSWFSCQSRSRFSCSLSNSKQIMWQPPCNSGLISSPGACPMVICRLYSLGRESFLPYPYPALLFLQSFPTGRPLFSGSLKWSFPLSFIIQGNSIAPWDTILPNEYFCILNMKNRKSWMTFPKVRITQQIYGSWWGHIAGCTSAAPTAEISDCYYNLLFRAILKLINLLFRDFAVRAHYEYTRLVYGLSFGTAIFSIWEEMIFSYAAFFANFNWIS